MKLKIYHLLIVLGFIGCKKEIASLESTMTFKDSAIQYLKNQLGNNFASLDESSTQVLSYRGKNIGLTISEKGTGSFILVRNDLSASRVTIDGIRGTDHNGSILLQTLDKSSYQKLIVENNQVTGIESSDPSKTAIIHPKTSSGYKEDSYVLPDVVVVAYVHTVEVDFWSLYWLFNENPFYNAFYTPYAGNTNYNSGGGGGNNSVVAAPKVNSPETPVTDVKDELKCFTSNSSSTCTVAVNVNQPDPGTRDVSDPFSSFPVGHTFLTIEEDNPDGSKTIRSIGFYPISMVKPGSAVSAGTFGDDSQTPYDVSLKMSLSPSELMTLITSLIKQQGMNYDLNNFNCTNSPISALASIGIHLPATLSSSLFFSGNDPADLGEDIRGLNLNTFSADNGGRKMTRTVSSSNNQNPPAKAGKC